MAEYLEHVLSKNYENYKNADKIMTLLFAIIDFIIILFSFFNFKSKNKKIYLLKYNLFNIFIIDIFLRIFNINNFYKEIKIIKECFLSILITIQFYLILCFLEQAYNDTRILKKGKFFKKLKINYFSVMFL